MPKRKRAEYGARNVGPVREAELKRDEFEKKLIHGKRLLNRALKTARGFERQKLGRRIKLAAEKQDETELVRLQRELDVAKSFDLSIAVDSHLYKALLKSKHISESALLPSYVKNDARGNDAPAEDLVANSNVTARLYNAKLVKEAMIEIIDSLYKLLGLPNPAILKKSENMNSKRKSEQKADEISQPVLDSGEEANNNLEVMLDQEEAHCSDYVAKNIPEGLDSGSDPNPELEDLSHYDHLVGDSTGEESGEENDNEDTLEGQPEDYEPTKNSGYNSSEAFSGSSRSSSPPRKTKKPTKKPVPTKSTSTFLPTLMGGYWSGSESATDDEAAPTPRKNRPGQQARRTLWEKKFGGKANHLKNGTATKLGGKDWDARRGAVGRDDGRPRRGRGGGRGGHGRFVSSKEPFSGENTTDVKPRARGIGKKDDAGALHPSWEAAKKAKEAKQTTTFLGKKVVFD